MDWMKERVSEHRGKAPNVDTALRIIEDIGERYHEFNDYDCQKLKETLVEMEGPQPGRVPLSTFYQKAMYRDWGFIEKADYLRDVGGA